MLTRHFYQVLSPSCEAEDSRSKDRFQVGLDCGRPCLQLASSSSAPRVRQCGKVKVLDQLTFGTSCDMTKPAEPSLHEQCRYACKAAAATRMAHSLCALLVECGGCCHCQRPPTSFRRLLVQAMSRIRRVGLSALLPGRPCPLYATIFHAATKDRTAGERMRNEQD